MAKASALYRTEQVFARALHVSGRDISQPSSCAARKRREWSSVEEFLLNVAVICLAANTHPGPGGQWTFRLTQQRIAGTVTGRGTLGRA